MNIERKEQETTQNHTSCGHTIFNVQVFSSQVVRCSSELALAAGSAAELLLSLDDGVAVALQHSTAARCDHLSQETRVLRPCLRDVKARQE